MSDLPPPPPAPFPGVPEPRPGPQRRPSALTGAAVILIVAGALAIIGGFLVINRGSRLDLPGVDGEPVAGIIAFVAFVLGGLDVLAGWLILRLSPGGRVLGIVIAVLGLLSGLAQLGRTGASGLLTLLLYGYVLYALIAYGFVFRRGSVDR